MLDEKALRRDTFDDDGAPTRMADGQTWMLPYPRLRYVFDTGPLGYRTRLGIDLAGDDFQELIDRRAKAVEAEDWDGYMAAELAIGRRMLLHNYDLTDEQLGELLVFALDPTDGPFHKLHDDVINLALGNVARPAAVASE